MNMPPNNKIAKHATTRCELHILLSFLRGAIRETIDQIDLFLRRRQQATAKCKMYFKKEKKKKKANRFFGLGLLWGEPERKL